MRDLNCSYCNFITMDADEKPCIDCNKDYDKFLPADEDEMDKLRFLEGE
jgi:hypothetical protein